MLSVQLLLMHRKRKLMGIKKPFSISSIHFACSPFVINVLPREIKSIDSCTQTNKKRLSSTSYLSDLIDVPKPTMRKSDVVSLGFQVREVLSIK